MPDDFATRLADAAAVTEAELARLLSGPPLPGETLRPPRLLAAMRHAALGGGKRLRPFLLIETARLFGTGGPGVRRAAAALECVHCYSLVHDDLPAMDDDDLRRGRPTVHRAFDEATAILAGDALLTLAFDVLADPATGPDPQVRAGLVRLLARAAGLGGMAGGQMLDLAAEGTTLAEADILTLQAMKTGALIRAACEMGALIGHADIAGRQRIAAFGAAIGLAFQLADDLLDHSGDAAVLGKAAAKDAGRGKATLVALLGPAEAERRLAAAVEAAVADLAPFGPAAATLAAAARFVAARKA
jgi:farnesyl diphosphate synthase